MFRGSGEMSGCMFIEKNRTKNDIVSTRQIRVLIFLDKCIYWYYIK